MSFEFSTVPHLISELGAAAQLGTLVAEHFPQVRNALIVTDAGFSATGLLDAPAASLRAAYISVQLYSGVLADPPEALILQAVAQAQQHPVDIVIGVGGG